jgi:hypothetical protein
MASTSATSNMVFIVDAISDEDRSLPSRPVSWFTLE